ncbi:MAG TPA: hypothetical protein VJR48_16555 [Ktedonobacterales bacterium]|nr:hypothetical protein [Ktedonobacterales bacterium]
MKPDEETAHLWAENTRQREQIAALTARARVLEGRLNRLRWALMLGVLAVLLAVGIGLLVARSQGAFESRLTYWRERGQNCGDIQFGPNRVLVDQSEAVQAVACFTAAHTICKAATLTRIEGGVDTSETDAFVVEPRDGGGGCDVGLLSIGGGITGTSTSEVQCASVTSSDDGELTISGCPGFGDITLPDGQPHPALPFTPEWRVAN